MEGTRYPSSSIPFCQDSVTAHFLVFGSHPDLSLAEARAVLGNSVTPSTSPLSRYEGDWDGAAVQERLAGVIKLGDILWEGQVKEASAAKLAQLMLERPRGERIEFGCTVYGAGKTDRRFGRLGMETKGLLKEQHDGPVRLVTGERGDLTPAAVAKAKLTTKGFDVVVAVQGERAWIGMTTHVQNADAWSLRDYGRPFRDAKTGMLPPKLARLMVNLAVGAACPSKKEAVGLLDPFCGGGTVLMEAAMLCPQSTIVGSDLDAPQVAGAEKNMAWLKEQGLIAEDARVRIFQSAAEKLDASFKQGSILHIVTEGFLGEPVRGGESFDALLRRKKEVEQIWKAALPVFAKIQKSAGRLVLVWPEWVGAKEMLRVDLTKDVLKLGYRSLFSPLGYARPDQRVKRWVSGFERLGG